MYEVVCVTIILAKFWGPLLRATPSKWNIWTAQHTKLKLTM